MFDNASRHTLVKPLLFALLSLALIVIDYQRSLSSVRSVIASLLYPIQAAIDLPFSSSRYLRDFMVTHERLSKENKQLATLVQTYAAREQKYRSIAEENIRLRALLKTDVIENDTFKLAKVLTVDTNRFRRTVMINKGSKSGLFEGQVAIVGNSIYGQVVSVTGSTSTVMQLTDPKHIIPVRNVRTGTLALAVGTGQHDRLELTKTESTNDVHVGDVFVTSGLGQVFPPDFPVAMVEKVTYNPSDSFTTVRAKTIVKFSEVRELLLIWQNDKNTNPKQPNEPSATLSTQDGNS